MAVVRFVVDVVRFVVDVVRFVVDNVRFVVAVVRFVVAVVKSVVDVVRFVVDVMRFVVDVVRFVVDALAELVSMTCISLHYRITDFLKTNLKMIEVDIVSNMITNTTYRQYSCTVRTVPYQENGKCVCVQRTGLGFGILKNVGSSASRVNWSC